MILLLYCPICRPGQAGPSSPEEYVQELMKFDFTSESVTEQHHGTVDKLRVSLSTNGLRYVYMYVSTCF